MMELNKDFVEFLDLLNKHQVDYMVVGGYALALHGKPRQTGDLDIWIDIGEANAAKMQQVIKDFGFGGLGIKEEDFLRENAIIQLGYPPVRIDILNAIDGVQFKEALAHRLNEKVEGVVIPFIGKEDFIKNKRASGRSQDLTDIKEIQA
ncbi:MAG: nucleotidyltransferase [Chitinophagaceae bacterium]|nr:nucleotidyltransferase [Chitinophagaceae bacterium]